MFLISAIAYKLAMDKYDKLEKVSEGSYGKVYKARDKTSGRLVAIKKTKIEKPEKGIPATSIREISTLKLLPGSIYVVKLVVFLNFE